MDANGHEPSRFIHATREEDCLGLATRRETMVKEDAVRLAEALRVLQSTFQYNRPRLEQVLSLGRDLHAKDVPLNTTAWSVVHRDVNRLWRNPEARNALAFHFERLRDLKLLLNQHSEAAVGSAMSNKKVTQEERRLVFASVAEFLLKESDRLDALLTDNLERLSAAQSKVVH